MAENKLYGEYRSRLEKIADLRYAAAVLQWDQETYLPPKGAAARSRQLATLTELAHNHFTDPSLESLLNDLLHDATLDQVEERNVSLTLEDLRKQKKLPSAFVRKMSEAVSAAFYSWIDARKQNDFRVYAPALANLVGLKKEEAGLLGYSAHPYDALLDQFEKGMTVTTLDRIFNSITPALHQLIGEVKEKQVADRSFLEKNYPKELQWNWGMYLVKELGFDFDAGRQDISEHPFTTSFSAQDVRITTRIDEHDFSNMTWSCIHETGHALYEQGLPVSDYGLPSGEFASLGIHESQSRLWENAVGRGKPFWTKYFPELKARFSTQLESIQPGDFLKAINMVSPSLIRTEADELTYHFHVIIRYQLEKELISGTLDVHSIPDFWNRSYKEYLGLDVPDDVNGCLQDVHWSHGSFGYFPTYSLGSFYAAQFWNSCKKDIPGVESQIAVGDFNGLLSWLREKIHRHGRIYDSESLCEKVTGGRLDPGQFIQYFREKINQIYA